MLTSDSMCERRWALLPIKIEIADPQFPLPKMAIFSVGLAVVLEIDCDGVARHMVLMVDRKKKTSEKRGFVLICSGIMSIDTMSEK